MKLLKLTTGTVQNKVAIYLNPLSVAIVKQQIGKEFNALVVHSGQAFPVFESADYIADKVNEELQGISDKVNEELHGK